MFKFLKKTKSCFVCGVSDKSRELVGFDPTNRGEYPELGKKENLCTNHLREKLKSALGKYQGFSVCYLPLKGWNSYSYITLEHALEWGVEKDGIKTLNLIIDEYKEKNSCNKCSKKSRFFLFDYSYDESRLKALESDIHRDKLEMFCGEHFAERIVREIESKNLKIDEINIPYGDRGIYMQGEF